MTVIKDEFKSREITRHDVLPLSFLKKSAYTGSKRQLSYKLEKTEVPEEEPKANAGQAEQQAAPQNAGQPGQQTEPKANAGQPEQQEPVKTKTVLRAYCWKGVYALSETDPESVSTEDFTFDDQGIDDAIAYLNTKLKELE